MNTENIKKEYKKIRHSWKISLNKLSGNLTTNEYMPNEIKKKLIDEDLELINKLKFEEIKYPKLKDYKNNLVELNILSGLQNIKKKDCLTLFRAIRFPTIKRIFETIQTNGFATNNYEQERILKIYDNIKYIKKRNKINKDNLFQTIPQERVINGLPIFALVNDAIQIHKAYRATKDKILLVAIHIPFKLIKHKKS